MDAFTQIAEINRRIHFEKLSERQKNKLLKERAELEIYIEQSN